MEPNRAILGVADKRRGDGQHRVGGLLQRSSGTPKNVRLDCRAEQDPAANQPSFEAPQPEGHSAPKSMVVPPYLLAHGATHGSTSFKHHSGKPFFLSIIISLLSSL